MADKSQVAATTAESQTASANLTVSALGQMLTERKSKRASSTPAKTSDDEPAAATANEQTNAADGDTEAQETSLESAAAKPDADGAAEGEAEPKGEGEDEGAAEAGEDENSKAVRKMQKRIDKLTAKWKEAEERAENAERIAAEEPKAAAQSQPAVRPADPLDAQFARDREVVDMDGQLAGLDNFMAWAAENPDGGEFTENGKSYQLGADELKQYRLQSERNARRLESRREARLESLRTQFRDARQKHHDVAVKLYPWIEQKESAEFTEAVAILRENPALMQRPDYELVVARTVAGERLEREALKKLKPGAPKPKPAVNTTPPKVVTQTLNASPKVNGARKASEAAEQKFQQSGRVEDLTTMLAQRRADRIKAAAAA